MTSERWQQIKELFQSAIEREPSKRGVFLDEACAGDVELRREVESLLACDDPAIDFLETPVLEAAPELLSNRRAESMVGRHIGPYEILREIGHGGMGTVYLAERADGEYRKRVAIKLVPRDADTESILRRFCIERQILAVLDHPNIAKLLDGGTTDDGLSYLVMDYVEGLPIDAYCDTHRLTTLERLKLFGTVCSAVHYAHQHRIVHRDLKPSNILVAAGAVPKLLDFGIAKLLDPELSSATSGTTITALRPMTPEYASPEQVRGLAITPASDIYSLGVLLYELLTGHRPYRFRSRTAQEIERTICESEPERPSRVIGQVENVSGPDGTQTTLTPASVSARRAEPPERLRRRLAGDLDNIVLMALRKEPERRYASVAQLSEDIRRYLEERPVRARKDTVWYRSAKFLKRNTAAVLAATLTAAILVLLAAGVWLFTGRGQIESLAVLPFVNVNADPNAEYLSDGIAETLMNHLSQLPDLKVLSRSLVFRYKGKELDPQAVGRALGVQAVVTGRVFQRDDQLSIRAELVDVRSHRHLWGDTYTRKLSDLLAVQEEIARKISDQLRRRLSGEEKQRLTKRYTENTEAYQLYLMGRFFWNKRTVEGFEKAIEYFHQAVHKDPSYALAYTGLADCYTLLGIALLDGGLPPKEVMPRAKAAALKALEIDDTLAEAHTSLAHVTFFYEWDGKGAEREFQRAIELNPNYATVHHWYATSLSAMGRQDEAIAEIKRALELEPFSLILNANVGITLYRARQYDPAIEQCRKTLEMDPSFVLAHLWLGLAYEQKSMYEEAIAEFQAAVSLSGRRPSSLALLGHGYAVSGQRSQAQKLLDELIDLSKQRYISPYLITTLYIGLGEKNAAFEWLEKSYEERSNMLVMLKVDPIFDRLRTDPRFADLVRRVGIWQPSP